MSMKMYELSKNYEMLLEKLYDDEIEEQALIDTLDSIEGEIEEKAENYAKIIRELAESEEKLKREEERIAKRRIGIANKKAFMKRTLQEAMEAVGVQKIKSDLFTISIQQNGGKAPLKMLVNVDSLPDEYKRISYSADNEKLRAWAEKGDCPYAILENRGRSVRIR